MNKNADLEKEIDSLVTFIESKEKATDDDDYSKDVLRKIRYSPEGHSRNGVPMMKCRW